MISVATACGTLRLSRRLEQAMRPTIVRVSGTVILVSTAILFSAGCAPVEVDHSEQPFEDRTSQEDKARQGADGATDFLRKKLESAPQDYDGWLAAYAERRNLLLGFPELKDEMQEIGR